MIKNNQAKEERYSHVIVRSKNNPDVDINMISYLGFPVNWPDGEVFGTVCLLDNKENHYNENYADLLKQVKS